MDHRDLKVSFIITNETNGKTNVNKRETKLTCVHTHTCIYTCIQICMLLRHYTDCKLTESISFTSRDHLLFLKVDKAKKQDIAI